ncbi:unnamed protein product [Urochloa decumbens]|uniref:Secreted protein n=1 Tax=Urochloa decumbens TaxID=240449 RepID=A0ABC8VFR0_9POAL
MDGMLTQRVVGIWPVKLLLLALSTTRPFIASHVVDGNRPVSKLLEMFSTCIGQSVGDGRSCRSPWSRLKLTSRTMILVEDTNSIGRPPDSKLWDRLRRSRLVRLPRDAEMCPSRLLRARKTSVTVFSEPQVIPPHLQQSVALSHELLRPPSWESSETNWSKELFSCSVQGMAREARKRSVTRAGANSRA